MGRPIVMPHRQADGASIVEGRVGLSREAVQLFDKAQKAGGTVELGDLRSWLRPDNLDALVRELEHFGLVDRAELPVRSRERIRPVMGVHVGRRESGGPAVSIAAGFEDAIVASGGWSRWG